MVLDRHGRLHDALGKFARHGRWEIHAEASGDRPGLNRVSRERRAANAFRPRRSGEQARDRYEQITGAAEEVRWTYEQVRKGEASWRMRESISYASPSKRDEARAKTGDVLMPMREARAREIGDVRDRREPRVGSKTTFAGKVVAVRGDAGAGTRFRNRAGRPRSAGMKMAPSTGATPTYTAGQLALATPARLREIATSMGIAIPPKAGQRMLTDLILGKR